MSRDVVMTYRLYRIQCVSLLDCTLLRIALKYCGEHFTDCDHCGWKIKQPHAREDIFQLRPITRYLDTSIRI